MHIISNRLTDSSLECCHRFAVKEFGLAKYIEGISLYSRIFDDSKLQFDEYVRLMKWMLVGYTSTREIPIAIGDSCEGLAILADLQGFSPLHMPSSPTLTAPNDLSV